MSDTVKIIGLPELKAKFKQLDDAIGQEAMSLAVTAGALEIVNEAKQNAPAETRTLARSLHIGNHPEKTPDFRSGEGYSDIGGEVRSETRVEVRIGTNLEYAAIHEFGGTIVPKNARFLTIPQTKAARAAAGGARTFPGKLHAIVSKDGTRGVLKDESGTVQYALVKSVRIPARPYLRPAFASKTGAAANAMGRALVMLLKKHTR